MSSDCPKGGLPATLEQSRRWDDNAIPGSEHETLARLHAQKPHSDRPRQQSGRVDVTEFRNRETRRLESRPEPSWPCTYGNARSPGRNGSSQTGTAGTNITTVPPGLNQRGLPVTRRTSSAMCSSTLSATTHECSSSTASSTFEPLTETRRLGEARWSSRSGPDRPR